MLVWRKALIVCGMLLLAACRIEINVPAEGSVSSESGAYNCYAGDSCEIEVSDVRFDETFIAQAQSEYRFSGWKKGSRKLCGGSLAPCRLATTGFVDYPNLLAVLDSDEVFYLEPTFIKFDAIRRYQLRDVITFTGTESVESPGQAAVTSPVTVRADFLPGVYSYADKDVLKLRVTVSKNITGETDESSIHIWQEEHGRLFDLNDEYGNYYWDAGAAGYGLESIPAPLVPSTNNVSQFYTLYGGHTSGPVTSGSRTVTVGKEESISVPLGAFIAYPVSVSDSYYYVSTFADNKRDSSVSIERFLWVSQEKGVIQATIIQQEFSSTGKLELSRTLNLKAIRTSF